MTLTELLRALDHVAELPAGVRADAIGALAAAQAKLMALNVTVPTAVQSTEDLDADQLAAAFNVPVSQVYEQARQGRIPCVRVGKYVRFSLGSVRAALAGAGGTETPAFGTRKKRSNRRAKLAAATAVLPQHDPERPAPEREDAA